MNDIRNTIDYKQNIGAISAILKQIEKLSPHPDTPKDRGPVSISVNNDIINIANNKDSIFGEIIIEGIINCATAGTFSAFDSEISAFSAIDCYDIYKKDGERNKIFEKNEKSYSQLTTEYERDLPQRIILERKLALLIRKVGNNELINDNALYKYEHKLKHDYMICA